MFNSLKSKFVLSFLVLEVIILSLIIGLNFNSLRSASKNLIEEKNETSTHLLIQIIKSPMIVYDLATIDEAVKNFSTLKGVVAVMVKDSRGVEISSYLKPNSVQARDFNKLIKQKLNRFEIDKKYVFQSETISLASQKIGDIYFIYTIDQANKTIEYNKNLTLALALASIIIGFLIS